MSTTIHSASLSGPSGTQLQDDNAVLRAMLLRKLTWLLLICYSLMLIKPVVPVIADVLAHTFNERQHMMTVHEEHGRFHIHYEQQKQEGNTDKNKPANTTKYQQDDYVHVSNYRTSFTHTAPIPEAEVYAAYTRHYPAAYADTKYIPPRNC